ncbi:MAG: hypothetical protein WCK77_17550 [Verrucomicrobiota bacterium]
MKALILGLFAVFASDYLALAEDIPFRGTEADVAKLTRYMLDSKEGKATTFPLEVKFEQIHIGGVFSGSKLGGGNNSLLYTAIKLGTDRNSERLVVYYFTVEPKLPQRLNASDQDWRDLLKNRKVTQYHILEYLTVGGKTKSKTLYLSFQKEGS